MSIIIPVGKIGLAVGMDWRLLPAASKQASTEHLVRELASDNDAQRVTIATRQSDSQKSAGLFMRPDPEDVGPGGAPGKLYAAAAVLAAMAGETQNVIAAVAFKDAANRERVAVLVVEGGLPVSDAVQAPEKAIDTVRTIRAGEHGFAGHRLFSNSPEMFGGLSEVENLSVEDLAHAAHAEARLGRIPANVRAFVGAFLALAVLLGGAAGGTLSWQSHQAKQRAAEARARDPLPKYEAALAEEIRRLGIARASMLDLVSSLESYAAWADGWELKQIACTTKNCRSTWERRGGTTKGLLASRPGEALEAAESSADKAILSWQPKGMTLDGWTGVSQAPRLGDALAANQSLYQVWANAGIRLQQSGGYTVWPDIGMEVPAEAAIKAQPIEVRLPWPLAMEAITQAPREVFWKQLSVAVDIGSTTQPLLLVLTGTSYVR